MNPLDTQAQEQVDRCKKAVARLVTKPPTIDNVGQWLSEIIVEIERSALREIERSKEAK